MDKICIKYNNGYIRLGDYIHLKTEPGDIYYKVCKIQYINGVYIITIMDYKGKFYTITMDSIDRINNEMEDDYNNGI